MKRAHASSNGFAGQADLPRVQCLVVCAIAPAKVTP
jgi:hypothetical protein